jgi:uncharacterized phiE125 gp8 family phage protein
MMRYTIGNEIRYKVASGGSPAEEPLTVGEVQTHLRVDGEDTYLAMLIKAARSQCEAFTCRAMVESTFEQFFDDFGPEEFALYWGPGVEVESIEYYDDLNVYQTLPTTFYEWNTTTDRIRVKLTKDESWPDVYDKMNAVKVTYKAGYADADAVPSDLKYAMLLIIGEMYERRENFVKQLPSAAEYLMQPYRLY